MVVLNTHIFLKENKYNGMGGKKIQIIKVLECKAPQMAHLETVFIKEELSNMNTFVHQEIISKEDFDKLTAETERVFDILKS